MVDGLIYNGICGPISVSATKETASPTDVASRLKWLRLQPRFFPQPYKQLANWMRESGDDAGALKVLAAKAEAQSENIRGDEQLAPERTSLGKRFPVLIALPFIFALLFVIGGSYFLRRIREGASDGQPTLRLLRVAIETYQRKGAGQRQVERAENESPPATSLSVQAGRATAGGQSVDEHAVFKREGDFWTIAYRGTTFRMKDVKGLVYIAYLLAHPGERFHVHELITEVEGRAVPASVNGPEVAREALKTQDLGDAGDALDQHAQVDYQRRIRELTEELAEAERFNDLGRKERLGAELEFLKAELSAALGSGGRNRRVASHVERARGVVTKNIRAGLEKIRSEDPALGRHFAASIRTGYYCAYLPDPDHKIPWQL
jgi:hypothetical protein